ncbi:MAG: 2-hydroxyacyl-CoA dehydratase [Candidatus Lokiarchaeota archaeon]|nr:2-hydroxyacyl-CoA dehydratase [Candidatus Lokiarchaeota archaeon]
MTSLVKDFITPSLLKVLLEYYAGKKHLQSAKRLGKKVCSMILPLGIEILNASGCKVVSLYRVGDFDVNEELRILRLSQNIFGIRSISSLLSVFNRTIGTRYLENFAEKLLDGLWNNYKEFIDLAANDLYPLDACFGTRQYFGASIKWKNWYDFTFGFGSRCIWMSKHFEIVSGIKPLIFMDIPTTSDGISKEYMLQEVNSTIEKLENLTGNSISEMQISTQIKLSNKIRSKMLDLFMIWKDHSNIISPTAFVYLFSMLQFGFTDHLSNPKEFLEILTNLNKDLKLKANKSIAREKIPRLLLTPTFGGFEVELMKIVPELGGGLIFNDWETLGVLEHIKEEGDVIENYSDYLLNVSRNLTTNTLLVKKWIDIVKKYDIEGVIFNSVYGCKSLTPSAKILKESLQEIDVPMLDLSFQNLDENIGQLKTRVGAYLEILRP